MNLKARSEPDSFVPSDGYALPAETVRAAVDRVLASRPFQQSEALRRFLSHAVEQTLAGRIDKLKEYSLGVDVFGRGPSFDPRIDSIVRVEASRLRSRLADYYHAQGIDDTVRIELPKGSYVPRFGPATGAPRPEEQPRVGQPAGLLSGRLMAAALLTASLGALWWLAGDAIRQRRPQHRATPPASIAVLPFVDLGAGKEVNHVSDAITEEVTNTLARIAGLRVTARTSAYRFKDRGEDVRDIGRQLGVATILQGSVRRERDRLRVAAQLINAADGYHLWSETYDRDADEILAIQASIAAAIAGNLRLKLASRDGAPIKRGTNTAAYHLLFKARYQTGTEDAEARIGLYRRALESDPSYADAHLALADEWMRLATKGTVPPRQVIGDARKAVERALELDDSLPNAHFLLAMIKWSYDWDWPGAARAFERSLQLNPNSATARLRYAEHLALMGRRPEALQQLEEIRVSDPVSAQLRSIEAAVYYLTGDYDRTIQHARTVLAGDDPQLWLMYYWMGRALDSKGLLPEAIAALEKWHGIPGALQGRGFGMLGSAYARAGRRADALKLLDSAIERSKGKYVAPTSIALIHIGLGDLDRALDLLQKAYDERDHSLVALKVDPAYDPLRASPKFQALLRRMKLE